MKFLLKNGRVWDGEKFLFADILTENEVIKTIAPAIKENADFVFDATEKTVTAGLVDLHMHMGGISGDSYAIEVHSACFPFGVTAACDAGARKGSQGLLESFQVKNAVFADSVIKSNRLDPMATVRNLALFGKKAIGIKLFYDEEGGKLHDTQPLLEVCGFARSRGS